MKRDILQILSGLGRGGIETWLVGVFRNSQEIRNRSAICLTGPIDNLTNSFEKEIIEMGIPIVRIPYAKGFSRLIYLVKLSNHIKINKFRCVHVHLNQLSYLSIIAAQIAGAKIKLSHHHLPVTSYYHGLTGKAKLLIMKTFENMFATYLLAPSRTVFLSEKRDVVENKKIVLKNGIDLSQYYDLEDSNLKKKLMMIENRRVIGHVGRFDEQKNHKMILEIVQKLKNKTYIEFLFLLIGNGPLYDDIKLEIQKKGLGDYFLLTGVRNDVLKLMYNCMDLFILPSLYEGLGIVLVEAQTVGLNCIVSETVPREAVISEDSVQFLPVDSKSAGLWADRIVSLLENQSYNHNKKIRIEDAKRSGYSIDECVKKLESLYDLT